MKYDFTTVANRRNIGAAKWALMLEKNPNAKKDELIGFQFHFLAFFKKLF